MLATLLRLIPGVSWVVARYHAYHWRLMKDFAARMEYRCWRDPDVYDKVRIAASAILLRPQNIELENNVYIGHGVLLDGTAGIKIGQGTQISARAAIYSHSSHIAVRMAAGNYFGNPSPPGYVREPVVIGRNVFIGHGAVILPGVTVGDGSLIGANSVVTSDVGEGEIVVGNPAQVVGTTAEMDSAFLAKLRDKGASAASR